DIIGTTADLAISGLIITEVHKSIDTQPLPPAEDRFVLKPNAWARRVEQLDLPPPNFALLASPKWRFSSLIPARLPQAPRNLIDLSDYYNAALVQSWHPGPMMGNNSLEVLPSGLLQLGGSVFDVRGIVQLAGKELFRSGPGGKVYPQQITGIQIGQRCHLLHFLHAAGWNSRDGTRIGSYIVRYADDSEQTIPIIYGEDVRDWNSGADASEKLKSGMIVWRGVNRADMRVRLFKSTWVNPQPEAEITSIDYVSTMASSAPFLLAITAEP
ncbi:MAG TPA: hypothetical protein VEC99_07440, partial [Clostridia bacterium]|nr:hypothetical protein [Clostridia bacterium]